MCPLFICSDQHASHQGGFEIDLRIHPHILCYFVGKGSLITMQEAVDLGYWGWGPISTLCGALSVQLDPTAPGGKRVFFSRGHVGLELDHVFLKQRTYQVVLFREVAVKGLYMQPSFFEVEEALDAVKSGTAPAAAAA